MPGNIVNIQFNEDFILGSNLFFSGLYNNGVSNTPVDYNWDVVPVRNAAFKVTLGTPTDVPGERSAINLMQALLLDLAATGVSCIRNVNQLVITFPLGNVSGYTFTNGFAFYPDEPFPGILDIDFTFGQQNTANLEIISVTFDANPTDRCGSVNVHVTANQIVTQITSPYDGIINDDDFFFYYPRGTTAKMVVKNGSGATAAQSFVTPPLLSVDNQIVTINNSPNGSTIIVNAVSQEGLIVTYALAAPNTTPSSGDYQADPFFNSVAAGTYWLYFKDQFGCVKYKSVIVSSFASSRSPYFFISKSMSFRFANRIDFGDAGNYKTDENTLSCEADVAVPWKEIQQFQTADVITTQFKSSYGTNNATIVKPDGTEIDVPVIQMSNNIGVKDRRDAMKVNLGDGKTGIYFTSGNIYDYDTSAVVDTYALNGTLPYWATFANFFTIAGAWYQVDEIYYDENLLADVLVIDVPYTGEPVGVIVGSIYNLFSYEVYEFTIDMVDYQDQSFQVRIDCSDPEFTDIIHLSEVINVKVKQVGTLEIKYSNPENTQVFYSTGITNLIRQPLTKAGAVPIETSDNYKTDTTTVLLSAEVYEGTQFTFEPVTTEIMRKMIEAFNHKKLQMNGVFYVKNGETEVEGPLEKSNLYVVKANLIKTAGAFNNDISGSDNELFDTTNTEIPGFIDQGNGSYIKYN